METLHLFFSLQVFCTLVVFVCAENNPGVYKNESTRTAPRLSLQMNVLAQKNAMHMYKCSEKN